MSGKSESSIQAEILRAIGSRPDTRCWRQNTAQGWAGNFLQRFPNGSVLIGNARPLHAGLFTGSADVIGIHSRTITMEDVGKTFGIFASIECKSPRGVASPAQLIWRDVILQRGGIAGIVRSVEEAEELFRP
jgi:hypothetical protein